MEEDKTRQVQRNRYKILGVDSGKARSTGMNAGKQQKVELPFSAKGREKLKESGQDRSRVALLGTKHGGVT